jgi:hypothetical protein
MDDTAQKTQVRFILTMLYNTDNIVSCLDHFDTHYQDPCLGGNEWHVHYYLDHTTKKCSMFW